MGLVRIRKYSYIFSIILVAGRIASLAFYGLKFGIDFTGGSLIEVQFESRPDINIVRQKIESLNFGQVVIQPAGDASFSIRTRELSTDERQKMTTELSGLEKIKDISANTIGPTIGQELRSRSIWAMALVLIAIILYIAFAFRKVSRPISSWFYGIFAVVALFHDVFIPLGVFSILGHFKGVEIDSLFITALLTVIGFSVHDTIVVFDRIRENLGKLKGLSFEETVNYSLAETLNRSLRTSLTVIFTLLALLLLGGESIRYFSLALLVGIVSGTYSSIFNAAPILVAWEKRANKRK